MKRHKINWRVPKGAELTELDKKVLFYQDKGHLVPTRQLIKTPEQIEGIRRSGVINTRDAASEPGNGKNGNPARWNEYGRNRQAGV